MNPTNAELKVFGWAPGHYVIKCGQCKNTWPFGLGHWGRSFSDKRSLICKLCAIKMWAKPLHYLVLSEIMPIV